MADLKPVYLITGDDQARVDAWRTRVRARAEAEGGAGALEIFDAAERPPADLAAALATFTLAGGTRFLLADGVERWKANALDPLEETLAAMPPDTVLVLLARDRVPDRLVKAVEGAGGEVREHAAPRTRDLPRWVAERAASLGLRLDAEAAAALVAAAGPRPGRLERELEKLAIAAHPAMELDAEEVERIAAGEASPQVYALADAVVAGDAGAALSIAEELRSADERATGLAFPVVRRLREVHRAAELLDAGHPERQVAGGLRLPPWAAKRVVASARRADRAALEAAICAFADLEVATRSGEAVDEDAAFTAALGSAASGLA